MLKRRCLLSCSAKHILKSMPIKKVLSVVFSWYPTGFQLLKWFAELHPQKPMSCFKRKNYCKEKSEKVAPDLSFLMLSLPPKSLVFFLRFFWTRIFPYCIWVCFQSYVSCPLLSETSGWSCEKLLGKVPQNIKITCLTWRSHYLRHASVQLNESLLLKSLSFYNFIHTCICKGEGQEKIKSFTQISHWLKEETGNAFLLLGRKEVFLQKQHRRHSLRMQKLPRAELDSSVKRCYKSILEASSIT